MGSEHNPNAFVLCLLVDSAAFSSAQRKGQWVPGQFGFNVLRQPTETRAGASASTAESRAWNRQLKNALRSLAALLFLFGVNAGWIWLDFPAKTLVKPPNHLTP